jgi:hypothetical protein
MLNKEKIVKSARSYKGCPYHHQGRVRDGMDCWGLIKLVADDNDLFFYDETDYKTKPDPVRLMEVVRTACQEISIDDASEGDVLVFWIKRGIPQHFGIITEIKGDVIKVVHAFANVKFGKRFGRVTEITLNEKWMNRIHSAFSYKVK